MAAAARLGEGDPEAVGLLLEGLLLTGLGMVVAGTSAPASGGEHLISHYLDMKQGARGLPHGLHGAQVGVATLYTLDLWERLLALDPAAIDPDALAALHPTDDEIAAWIQDDWGPRAPDVLEQWRPKALSAEALRHEIERFRMQMPHLSEVLYEDLLPASDVARAIEQAGGPVRPEQLEAPLEEFEKARRVARFVRDRFTVLDLAAELQVA